MAFSLAKATTISDHSLLAGLSVQLIHTHAVKEESHKSKVCHLVLNFGAGEAQFEFWRMWDGYRERC